MFHFHTSNLTFNLPGFEIAVREGIFGMPAWSIQHLIENSGKKRGSVRQQEARKEYYSQWYDLIFILYHKYSTDLHGRGYWC
jgi:hypothetical protein